MKDKVLGFDIRIVDSRVVSNRWDTARRERYLIRPDVECPVSVDTVVLPSIFEFSDDGKGGTGTNKIVVRPMGMHQLAFKIWRDKNSMIKVLTEHSGRSDGAAVLSVAIVAVDGALRALGSPWEEVLDETVEPEVLGDDWQLIGYDVADRYLTSGLSNCGYDENEKKKLPIKNWAARINDYGLLERLDWAVEFKQLTDQRVREHAPFLVFGLYRQKQTKRSRSG